MEQDDTIAIGLPTHELDEEQSKKERKSRTPKYLRDATGGDTTAKERGAKAFPADLQEIFFPGYGMDDGVREYLRKAETAARNGSLYEALHITEEGIGKYPNSAELHSLCAAIESERPIAFLSRRKAERLYQKAVQLDPYNEDIRIEYASFLERLNREDEAEKHREIIKLHKLSRLSETLCKSVTEKRVIKILEEAEEAHNMDKHGVAHQLLERGSDEFPDSVELQIARAYYRHISVIDSDKAIYAYRKAIEMDPQNPTARALYVKFLTDFGRFAEARDQMKMLLNTYPNNEMLASYWNSITDAEKQGEKAKEGVCFSGIVGATKWDYFSSRGSAFDRIGSKTISIVTSAAIGGMVGGAIGGYYSQADPACGPAGVALGAFLGVLFLHMAD